MNIVEAAAALRLPCFPVREDKRPCIRDWPRRAASTPKQVRRLWRAAPGPLIGVLCGESSGIDVLDIDPRNGGAGWFEEHRDRLPTGRQHCTRSGGLHILFRHCEAARSTVLAGGVDVLANGRFICWWPAAGFGVVGTEIPDWPEWLLWMMRRAPHTHSPAARAEPAYDDLLNMRIGDIQRPISGYTRVAVDKLFWLVANSPEGERTIKLNMAAFRLGRLGVPFDKAEAMLWRAARRCGLDSDPVTDIDATIRGGYEAGVAGGAT